MAVRAVGKVLPAIAQGASAVAQALERGGRLLYVGAGTSGRLGALDAAECPPTFGTQPEQVQAVIAGGPEALTRAVEGAEDDREAGARALEALEVGPHDVVCGISASGQTRFVHGALEHATSRGAHTLLVTCNPAVRRLRLAQRLIVLNTGAELVAGSTRLKAGTATKLVLNALTTAAMVALGRVQDGLMVNVKPTNRKLKARAARIVAALTGEPPDAAMRILPKVSGRPRLAVQGPPQRRRTKKS